MKNIFFTLLIICVTSIAFAGNGNSSNEKNATKLISGKIIDKTSGEEIAGAEILIGDQKIYSDLNGNFSISIPMVKQTAIVKFISYNDTEVAIDPISYAPVIIELSGK
ncbi:MAG: hypothetical protein JWP12_2166 [Bacteroidetes bacterium]|nr:hypothetical protein [Bacteroidota bacterium]